MIDVLDTGPEGYGLLLAAPGAGALLAAFGLAALGRVGRPRTAILATLLAFAATLAGFAVSRELPLALLLLCGTGASQTWLAAIGQTVLQLRAPSELRGRVIALNTTATIGLSSLGGLSAGLLASAVGAPEAVLFSAVATAILGSALVMSLPALNRT
ncbi:MAG TPA: MFS transporter [Chloroflexota bacterium]|nr:MFS transporter [Chloroflexota bacterium]